MKKLNKKQMNKNHRLINALARHIPDVSGKEKAVGSLLRYITRYWK